VKGSTSKWSKLSRDSYAVGALARFNNNSRLLHPEAAKVAAEFNLTPVNQNLFMNHIAQLVECFHAVHDTIRLIEELVDSPTGDLKTEVTPKAGEGIGAVEAPWGLLVHHYPFDEAGTISKANCVVPATQNNANIHHDLKDLVRKYALEGMTDEKLEFLCSMLVRSYDPCISCSVHQARLGRKMRIDCTPFFYLSLVNYFFTPFYTSGYGNCPVKPQRVDQRNKACNRWR